MSNTSRRTSVTYPNGRVVNLGYGSSDSIDDLFSLVKSAAISGESGNKVEYSRAGLGRFVKITYPQPGVEMSMIRPGGGSEGDSGDPYDGYDRFGRVQEMRWQSSSTGTPIDAWQWGYNESSNRTWKKNLVAASGQDEAYGYDGLYQVIRDAVGTLNTNRTAIGGVPGEAEDFTYDPTGNWLGYRKDTNGTAVLDQTRSNNKDNQLEQIDGSSSLLSYDRAGNATKTAPGTGADWTKYYQPVWDAWNRIVEVKNESGSSVQKNAYDGLTRRITKEASSVVTHTYWSDRWKPLEERTGASTSASRSYLWGERPGHRDELILRDRDTDGNGSLDERLYATMDYFNGTAVLNTSGVVQERYAYTAFGVRRIMAADFSARTSSSFAWDFGFQGQFRDGETGWSNYGFRFYVPKLGRWINRDPIGEGGGVNIFESSRNNAIQRIDYLGLVPIKTQVTDNDSLTIDRYESDGVEWEEATVKKCNIVFFARHADSRPRVVGENCTGAAVYSCFKKPNFGVDQNLHIQNVSDPKFHTDPGSGLSGLTYSTDIRDAIHENWEKAKEKAQSFCEKDCCKSVLISVDCTGLNSEVKREMSSGWYDYYFGSGGVCSKRETVECESE